MYRQPFTNLSLSNETTYKFFHVSIFYKVFLYSTFYLLCSTQSFRVNSYKPRILNLLYTSWLFNSKFNFFIRIFSEIIIELSNDLLIIEKQFELISSSLQYIAIGWIRESSTCPKRYTFMLFNVCRQVTRGLVNVTWTFCRRPICIFAIFDSRMNWFLS